MTTSIDVTNFERASPFAARYSTCRRSSMRRVPKSVAEAIISHRPYHGKDDLTNRKIIPENVYNEIKDTRFGAWMADLNRNTKVEVTPEFKKTGK